MKTVITRSRQYRAARAVLVVADMAAAGLVAGAAWAAVIVPNDAAHVISGTVQGTLVAIDVPTLVTTTVYTPTSPGGPSWTTGDGIIAHVADQGFYIQSRPGDVYGTRSPWEPDGTPLDEAQNYGVYNGTDPEVIYYFNLANSGIDIPDGSVINAVYMTWVTRGKDNANWTYDEVGDPVTVNVKYFNAVIADLVLRWYPSDAAALNANFQKVFAGPITVDGGDGFVLKGVRQPNTLHADAIVLDVTLPSTASGGTVMLVK